jgi:hypothetical protein
LQYFSFGIFFENDEEENKKGVLMINPVHKINNNNIKNVIVKSKIIFTSSS